MFVSGYLKSYRFTVKLIQKIAFTLYSTICFLKSMQLQFPDAIYWLELASYGG